MSRNSQFNPAREPMRHDPSLALIQDKIHGPFASLNPTQARFNHTPAPNSEQDSDTATSDKDAGQPGGNLAAMAASKNDIPVSNVEFKWTTRNNRKGRHALVVKPTDAANAKYYVPPSTATFKEILKGIWRMFTYYPYWDVSWLVAFVFTWGSVVWVINAFFIYLPLLQPSTTFSGEELYGGGISAFIGATIFEIGSILLMFEAVNENRTGCFGWAVDQLYDEHVKHEGENGTALHFVPAKDGCTHHHQNSGNLVGQPKTKADSSGKSTGNIDTTPDGTKSWVWWPSAHELRTHYIHDLGFLACSFQTVGATVFWISGFTALPGILNKMSPGLTDGIYWTPQVIGGCGFIISGMLFMIETQKHWWQPALGTLGWHIGFWNCIGGIGFTLSPCFGFSPASWTQYQAACSTFWGSWAFLIGSAMQWYESLDKHPVEVDKSMADSLSKSPSA